VANEMQPGLFGLSEKNSNRDFSKPATWGKNQFNTSFPVSLACYMYEKHIDPIYLELNKHLKIEKKRITAKEIFGLEPLSKELYFSFESAFQPYEKFVVGKLPRIDLVTLRRGLEENQYLRPCEIKLTALPDNSTADFPEDRYGCEIVVRPDSILYLALSVAKLYSNEREELRSYLEEIFGRKDVDWSDEPRVRHLLPDLVSMLDKALKAKLAFQSPFMMQQVWKTEGKTLRLNENCFDIFVWSNFAFTRLFVDEIHRWTPKKKINRPMRTVVWLSKMLYSFSVSGRINYEKIIDTYTYGTKNDKAFAVSGRITNKYMVCPELIAPRIGRDELRYLILGGGERFLSPERRLDVTILAMPELFEQTSSA